MALKFLPRRKRARAHDGQMPVMDHLAELRNRILISALAVTIGAVVVFFLSNQVIHFLVTYYKDATNGKRDALIVLGPVDGFVTRLKIATYGGIILALPVWLFELWRFITPGLNPKERKYA